ncbi:fructosamine-3-kinase [Alteromonadaceae bacterium 2753L.S.0a.02]|nr:fructosamine-3-kinase [Alteromonadaceae bacterium 2753L.S.0a.02]
MNSEVWDDIRKTLSIRLQRTCSLQDIQPVSGGDINDAYAVATEAGRYFVKISRNGSADAFTAEQAGLECLGFYQKLRVPHVVCLGICGSTPYLVLEYIPLNGSANDALLGNQLAELHLASSLGRTAPFQPPTQTPFGFSVDNYIGLSRQCNTTLQSWCEFWLQNRLGYQIKLASENGYSQIRALENSAITATETLLKQHFPPPCVVHGDLWGGNKGYDLTGTPIIYDPAAYFGDREVDIALSHLFGGFSEAFYRAYQKTWPLPEGFQQRQTLYNLYHQLNHLNLFGGVYLGTCIASIKSLEKYAAAYG